MWQGWDGRKKNSTSKDPEEPRASGFIEETRVRTGQMGQ